MGEVKEALQVGVFVLIAMALLVALVIVWRDDHKWRDRRNH